jgi:uncharacterized repeat protein (TIGR01451 family)
VAAGLMPGADAAVVSTTGTIIQVAAPPNVSRDQAESPTNPIAFDELQGVTLASPLVVNYVVPGPHTATILDGKLPTGTILDSHLVHNDPVKGTSKARRLGTVTFSDEIIGVITATSRLAASDFLGAPGTVYGGTTYARGFEGSVDIHGHNNSDRYSISPDRKTISLDFKTSALDEIRILTHHADTLETTIVDSPDPVTVGNDVQYTLSVKNNGLVAVPAHVVDTLPAGATLVFAPPSCTGTTLIDCDLGSLAGGATASVKIVVNSAPSVGTMTNTAVATPGSNASASETTTIEALTDGTSKGWVMPGNVLATPGHDPAQVSLPNTGPGAPVIITQDGAGNFCGGPCVGPTTNVAATPDYDDTANPVKLKVTYNFAPGDPESFPDALTAAAIAFSKSMYTSGGTLIAPCAPAGTASPDPCLNAKTISEPVHGSFAVTFEILYTSGPISVGRN